MGKRIAALALAGALGMGFIGAGAAPASASGGNDVIREGSCSGTSDWKLKLSEENGALEVEFEVDQNVVGDVWKVQLLRNGERFFQGRQVIADPAGPDTVRAIAKNPATGEVCRGTATSDF
jgi:hypothetical protein